MTDLGDTRWALVTYSYPAKRPWTAHRMNSRLKPCGIPIRPQVYLVPRSSVPDLQERILCGLRRYRDAVKIFITYVHPLSDPAIDALIQDRLNAEFPPLCAKLARYRASYCVPDCIGLAQYRTSRGVPDCIGEQILAMLEGARNVLQSTTYTPEMFAPYKQLYDAWMNYYGEVHKAVLAETREPLTPKRYRVAAGRFYNLQQTPPLPGFECAELTDGQGRKQT